MSSSLFATYTISIPSCSSEHDEHHERIEEPSVELEETYENAYAQREKILRRVEDYSHFGIFMFINNYHINWVDLDHGRDASVVQKAMLDILFPLTDHDEIWEEYRYFRATSSNLSQSGSSAGAAMSGPRINGPI